MKSLPVVLISLIGSFASAQETDTREAGLTGTGIYGIITELGSFYVNGQRITYSEQTVAQSALGPLPASELRPGDTVAAQVSLVDDVWLAKDIREIHPIIGPVSNIGDQSVTIMGTRVDLSDLEMPPVAVGDWVAVDGLWRGDDVVASQITMIDPQQHAHLLGSFLGTDEDDNFRIGGTLVMGITPQHASSGDVMRIAGEPVAGSIIASTIKLGLFAEPFGHLLAQGYLSRPDQTGQYTLLGSGLSAFTEQPEMINNNALVTYCGHGAELSDAVFLESNSSVVFKCGSE